MSDTGGAESLGVDEVERRRSRRRKRTRVAMWTALVVLGLCVAFVVYAGDTHIGDPNQPASQDAVDEASALSTRALDRWRLPETVIRSPVPDSAHAYGYGGIEVTRHFRAAPGIPPDRAARDLVAALEEQGYRLPQDLMDDASWGADGNCRLPEYPDCLLVIELVGRENDLIDAVFLPT